jgi:hypothetical protein
MAKKAMKKGVTQKQNREPIQVVGGNTAILTVQLLNSINQNLGVLITYLKNRDIENGRSNR